MIRIRYFFLFNDFCIIFSLVFYTKVEAQAITTSKWDTLEPVAPEPPTISCSRDSDDSDYREGSLENSRDIDEEKRNRLREIELKAMQYQDEIESGNRTLKQGWTIQQQVTHYRRKLLKKSDKDCNNSDLASDRYNLQTQYRKDRRSPSPSQTDS